MDADSEMISIARPRTYCLKCLEHLCPRKYLPKKLTEQIRNSVEIDMQEYPRICNDWGVRRYEKNLEELYKDVYDSFSDLSDYEIGEIMKRRMEAIEAFI